MDMMKKDKVANTTTAEKSEKTAADVLRCKIEEIDRVDVARSKRDGKKWVVIVRAKKRWTLPAYVANVPSSIEKIWTEHEGETDEDNALVNMAWIADAVGIKLGDGVKSKIAAAEKALADKAKKREVKERKIVSDGLAACRTAGAANAEKKYHKLAEKWEMEEKA